MCRGFGKMQMCLLSVIGNKPMTFEEILTAISPAFNDSKWMRTSNFALTRSLRRALSRLIDLDVVQIRGGRRPHRYHLNPLFRRDEYDPERISLGYQCLSFEEGGTLSEKNANLGRAFANIAGAVADLKE